ncbi:MAG: NADH-quinone oxidoreductase subunit A [Acidobacteria bacterium]|nr:NADH-quinone oxidoreductase subunit A [Acidobacteriota bacterium]
MVVIGAGLPLVTFLVSRALAPRKDEDLKRDPYECGLESTGEVREKISIRYYLVAVLFVVFDVETIFLFPWAVRYRALGLFGFVEMTLFIAVLLLGYFYVLKKGALRWGTMRSAAALGPGIVAQPTQPLPRRESVLVASTE